MERTFRFVRNFLRPKRWLFALLSLMTLAALGFRWCQTVEGNRLISYVLKGAIEDVFPKMEFDIGLLETDLLTELHIDNLRMGLRNKEPIILVKSIAIDFDVWKLNRRDVAAFLVVDTPQIRLRQTEDGLNISSLFATADTSETTSPTQWPDIPFDIHLPVVEVSAGSVTYDDIEAFFELDSSIRWDRTSQVEFGVNNIGITVDDLGDVRTQLDVEGDGDLITIDAIVGYGEARVGLTGEVTDLVGSPKVGATGEIFCPEAFAEKWIEQAIPSQDVLFRYTVEGGLDEIQLTGTVKDWISLDAAFALATEEWNLGLNLRELPAHLLVPDIEETILAGQYQIVGKGTSWPSGVEAEIEANADSLLVWKEHLRNFAMKGNLIDGTLRIDHLGLLHDIGQFGVLGNVGIASKEAQVNVMALLNDFTTLERFGVPYIDGNVGFQGSISGTWKEEVAFHSNGDLTIDKVLSEFGELQSGVATVDIEGGLEGVTTTIDVTASDAQAVGVNVEEMNLHLEAKIEKDGGVSSFGEVLVQTVQVGDGTVILDDLKGGFEAVVPTTGDIFFTTNEMTIGQFLLVPAQYKVDGGPIEVTLDKDDLVANLHLTRKNRAFVDLVSRANLSEGLWRVEELYFSPTVDRGWSTERGIEFHLTDEGVDNLELAMSSEVGTIRIAGNSNDGYPDVSLGVENLQIDYVAELVDLFVGEGLLPLESTGKINGELNFIGAEGIFGRSDYFSVSDLFIPGLIEQVEVKLDIGGKLEHPKFRFLMQGKQEPLPFVWATGSWPLRLDVPSMDCTQSGQIQVDLNDLSMVRLRNYLPLLPDMDILGSAQLGVEGEGCDPKVAFSAMTSVPVGKYGERIRGDITGRYADGQLSILSSLEEGLQPLGKMEVQVNSNLDDSVQKALKTLVWTAPEPYINDLSLMLSPTDLSVERMMNLFGFEIPVQGEIKGELSVRGPVDNLNGVGGFWVEDGWIGEQELKVATTRLKMNTQSVQVTSNVELADGTAALTAETWLETGQVDIQSTIQDIELSGILSLIPSVTDGTGIVDSEIRVTGNYQDPVIEGDFSLQDLGLTHRTVGIAYRDIDLNVLFREGAVFVSQCTGESTNIKNRTGKKDWGSFEATANISYGEQMTSTGSVMLDRFWLLDNSLGFMELSGDLNINQDSDQISFGGNIYVNQGGGYLDSSFFVDDSALALSDKIQIHRVNVKEKSKVKSSIDLDEMMKGISGTLMIDLGDRVSARAEIPLAGDYGGSFAVLSTVTVDTTLSGKVNAGLENGQPTVVGTISTKRGGELRMMGVDFTIGEGDVIFNGADYVNPQMDLLATKDFGSYGEVSVSVGGAVDSMTVGFDAQNTPYAYDQTDIISLILIGKPAQELADSESQTTSALFKAALSTMGSTVGDALGGNVIDEVDWDPTEGMFRIGKTINDSMFLSYLRDSGAAEDENMNEITLEWLILNRVYAEFVTGDANNSQATVYYRWLF